MKKVDSRNGMLVELEQLHSFVVDNEELLNPIISYLYKLLCVVKYNISTDNGSIVFIYNKSVDMYDIIFKDRVYIGANNIALQMLIKAPNAIYLSEDVHILYIGYNVYIVRGKEELKCNIFNYTERLSTEEIDNLNKSLSIHYDYYDVDKMAYIDSNN